MNKEVIAHFRDGKVKLIKIAWGLDVFIIANTINQTKHENGTITFDAVSSEPAMIVEMMFNPFNLTFDFLGTRKIEK